MIAGRVNDDLEPIIQLTVSGPTGRRVTVDAVVDTGFNGFLTLPPTTVENLSLVRLGNGRATLADGTEEFFDIHEAEVLWDGKPVTVDCDKTPSVPLVGMRLLRGFDLWLRGEESGDVRIEPIPGRAQRITNGVHS